MAGYCHIAPQKGGLRMAPDELVARLRDAGAEVSLADLAR